MKLLKPSQQKKNTEALSKEKNIEALSREKY
jgi:hypothetical protein